MAFPTYTTGTVSIGVGATTAVGTGTIWSGVNARAGDLLLVAGALTFIKDVTDATHLVIPAWQGSAQTSVAYTLFQTSPLRFAGGQTLADVSAMIAGQYKSPVVVPPASSVPDASYGNEGQYAFQPTTGKYWLFTSGVWVYQGLLTGLVLRNYIDGLTLSMAGSSATFSVATGVAVNSTNTDFISLASAYTKTTSAWAVGSGNGALDTGSIGSNIWYHAHLIKRPDTGVVDILISLSATAPTLPTNYTSFRRIGAMKLTGSSQWLKVIQDGDLFQHNVTVADIAAANPGTSAVLRTLSTPSGISTIALMQVGYGTGVLSSNPAGILISDPAVADSAPGVANATLLNYAGAGTAANFYTFAQCRTNTSSQVRSRLQLSDANISLNINTTGWIDRRGRDL